MYAMATGFQVSTHTANDRFPPDIQIRNAPAKFRKVRLADLGLKLSSISIESPLVENAPTSRERQLWAFC